MGRVGAVDAEQLGTVELEALVGQLGRQAQGLPWTESPGHGGRHDQLRQIDPQTPGSAQHVGRTELELRVGTLERTLRIVGIHATVAVDGHADPEVGTQLMAVGNFRDEEIL